MKRKKIAKRRGDRAPVKNKSELKEPCILDYKPGKTSKLIFDICKEFIDIDDETVLEDLSVLFKKYVNEYNMMVSRVYFDPDSPANQHTIYFSQIDPKQLSSVKRMVQRKDVILEIYGRQAIKKYYKDAKLKLTEEYYETPDTVYPDEYRKKGAETLRATLISMLLRNGAAIQAVAQHVGHRSIASTAKYAPKLTTAQIKKQYLKAHPKA